MSTDALSRTLSALADPTRRQLLAQLAEGDATVKTLAEPFDMTLAAVSKHLKVLEGAGLISRGRQSQWRPCHLEAKPLKSASEWLEGYRHFWDASLDSLAAHLETMTREKPKKRQERGVRTRRSAGASRKV